MKNGNKKAFTSHFAFDTEMMRYRAKMVRFKTWFRAKNGMIREKITLLRANQIAEITRDFEMDVIKRKSLKNE